MISSVNSPSFVSAASVPVREGRFVTPRFGHSDEPVGKRPLPPFTDDGLKPYRAQWKEPVARILADLDRQELGETLPMVGKTLDGFGLSGWQGIPPALEAYSTPDDARSPRLQSTHGALAMLALKVVGELPAADNAWSAYAQIKEALQQVSTLAHDKAESVSIPGVTRTHGIGIGRFSSASMTDELYSMLLIAHMVLVTPNGAIQVNALPGPAAMADMIEADPQAKQLIDDLKPVDGKGLQYGGGILLKGSGLNAAETLQLLRETGEGQHPTRYSKGWRDVHTLLRTIPFDLQTHVKSGQLKPIFEKAGADGRKVLEKKLDLEG